MSALITLSHVTLTYGAQRAVHDVSGVFQRGSLTAIAGPNGAGKSTLLKAIVGIIKPKHGTITLALKEGESIAYLPQATSLQRDFPLSVEQAVCTGFWSKLGLSGAITPELRTRARAALDAVALADVAGRPVNALSGGQFQRLLFARVILQDAAIILLDEPFAAVDAETTARLMQLVLSWHREGRTVICVLHDLLMIQKYFPESFVLSGKGMGHGHTHHLLEQKILSFDLDIAELCPGHGAEAHHHHD